ncbi:MAG TPA: PQQ-binding-like beta-propeller repeat protein [Humisphaera sp.]
MKLTATLLTTLLALAAATTAHAAPPEAAGPAGRKVLAMDYSRGRVAMVEAATGKVLWQRKCAGSHDLHLLPNGNVLVGDGWTKVTEVKPGMDGKEDEVVWQYDAAKQNRTDGKRVEVHAFQRLADGNTMIAESGPARIIEVDKDGKLVKEVKLKTNHPSTHSDTRLARKLDTGNYLVCQEADGTLREYDAAGKVVWEYEVPLFDKKPAGGHGPEAWGNHLFGALRLPNGNTLIATGNGHSVIEVTPEKKVVWHLAQKDLEGVTLAWVTTLQVLPNGNIVIGNCHATDKNPQVIEVTREKKLVWQYKDFKTFGDATSNSMVVDAK